MLSKRLCRVPLFSELRMRRKLRREHSQYMTLRLSLFSGSEFVSAVAVYPWYPLLSYLYGLQTVFMPFVHLVYEPPVDIWFSAWRTGLVIY